MTFPTVVERRARCGRRPLEFFVAMGFGRSYGQESKFFGKKFSGILQSGFVDALDCAPRARRSRFVADVGNDLAYEAPVETIVEWVSDDARSARRARCARSCSTTCRSSRCARVGAVRDYRVLRRSCFRAAGCRAARCSSRAERLSEALAELAAERKIPVFSGENAWYGLDPIHPAAALGGRDLAAHVRRARRRRERAAVGSAAARRCAASASLQADSWSHAASRAAPRRRRRGSPTARRSRSSECALRSAVQRRAIVRALAQRAQRTPRASCASANWSCDEKKILRKSVAEKSRMRTNTAKQHGRVVVNSLFEVYSFAEPICERLTTFDEARRSDRNTEPDAYGDHRPRRNRRYGMSPWTGDWFSVKRRLL